MKKIPTEPGAGTNGVDELGSHRASSDSGVDPFTRVDDTHETQHVRVVFPSEHSYVNSARVISRDFSIPRN